MGDVDGQAALWRAACDGDVAAVAAALARPGVDVNEPDGEECSPLLRTAERGHLDAFRLLLAAGGDVTAWVEEGQQSVVRLALWGRNGQLLREAIVAREAVQPALSALHVAAAADDDGTAVRSALRGGHCPLDELSGERDGYFTALHVAAACDNVGAVEALVAAGASVDAAGGWHTSPLGVAAERGHVRAMRALLQAGARVNVVKRDYGPPLLLAARYGEEQAITMLLAWGADVEARMRMAPRRCMRRVRTRTVLQCQPFWLAGRMPTPPTTMATRRCTWHVSAGTQASWRRCCAAVPGAVSATTTAALRCTWQRGAGGSVGSMHCWPRACPRSRLTMMGARRC